MTKITHIFKTYFPETNGGLEEAIRQIGTQAIDDGYEVEVVAVGKRAYEITTLDGITVHFYKTSFDLYSNPVSLSFIQNFKNICKSTDILHFHFTWPTAELLTLLYGIKKPMVVTFHCDIHKNRMLKTLYFPVVKQFLKKADKICVTTNNLLRNTPYLHKFKEKTEEICLWFDENRFKDLPEPDTEIKKLTDKIGPYGLFVGVLRWYKGLDTLLDASKKTRGNIIIVGKGPLYNNLKKRIEKEALTNVYLLGFQPDKNLELLIKQSQFIVLPSISAAEAFGQILLEGLYFSKPLISTELGTGTSLANRHNHTGLVVKPGCAPSLARAMNRIFHDIPLQQKLKKNTFQHLNTNFTKHAQGYKYSTIYKNLLKKTNPRTCSFNIRS